MACDESCNLPLRMPATQVCSISSSKGAQHALVTQHAPTSQISNSATLTGSEQIVMNRTGSHHILWHTNPHAIITCTCVPLRTQRLWVTQLLPACCSSAARPSATAARVATELGVVGGVAARWCTTAFAGLAGACATACSSTNAWELPQQKFKV